MAHFRNFVFKLLTLALVLFASSAGAYDIKDVEKDLASAAGALVEVHGANAVHGGYVLSFRDPQNFFSFILVSMIPDDQSPNAPKVAATMATLKRNDIVRVRGRFDPNLKSPQPHAYVSFLEVEKPVANPHPSVPAFQPKTDVEKELGPEGEEEFKVHGIFGDGKILVVEYGDAVIPVYVSEPSQATIATGLFRGDLVNLKYRLATDPSRPTHLRLQKVADAIQLTDEMRKQHGQKFIRICGQLAMFPKSPLIKFNVFAMEQPIGKNLSRTYTLVNFTDPALFAAMRDKLQKAWDKADSSIVSARNYFLNPRLKVCASGTGNIIDPNQANPQILIEAESDLEVSPQ